MDSGTSAVSITINIFWFSALLDRWPVEAQFWQSEKQNEQENYKN